MSCRNREPRNAAAASGRRRVLVSVRGVVQGVGFRPFVYRLARGLGLAGWVANDGSGVRLEAEGPPEAVERFLARLVAERPPRAEVRDVAVEAREPAGGSGFRIEASAAANAPTAVVLSDGAPCAECLAEVLDPANRRHRYPFTSCTQCGPRFTVVTALPYDRPNTTMQGFPLCAACRREYEDPLDRRFHAEPNACPACGPSLALLDARGAVLARGDEALRAAGAALREGRIVAGKGLGGFHLLCDARVEETVRRLRERKAREEKPLALMVRDLAAVRDLVEGVDAAERLLASPVAPIVLLPRRAGAAVAPSVAPRNPRLGVMLPATPLHHLLLREVDGPLVATSGNRTDEPICTGNEEALARLAGIADLFLVHDRPIARHVDDSVVRVDAGGEAVPLRRARGLAPLPVRLARPVPCLLAVGAHLKNTVALSVGDQVFVSQHVGDLETPEAQRAFASVIRDFLRMYAAEPVAVAHDLHPDYASTRWALASGRPTIAVQHHHAHLAACLAERGADGPALGVTWDGTGHGTDGTAWGGEFLVGDAGGFRRVATIRAFGLPGGDVAAREPRRVALALLWQVLGEGAFGEAPADAFSTAERGPLTQMLATGRYCPPTTSVGRLFDAVAALVGLRDRCSFEGQAAMELEGAVDERERGAYPFPVEPGPEGGHVADWRPLVAEILAERRRGVPAGIIAARFHGALAEVIVQAARRSGERRVALTGGCFQNGVLLARARARLVAEGFEVLTHRHVPPNDGGISLGQIAVAAARLAAGSP